MTPTLTAVTTDQRVVRLFPALDHDVEQSRKLLHWPGGVPEAKMREACRTLKSLGTWADHVAAELMLAVLDGGFALGPDADRELRLAVQP